MTSVGKAVGRGKPKLPADVRLVQEWLNWWVTALNHLPFARLEDGIAWFQGEVTGDPAPSGVVEPHSTTESNLQQRPKIAPATFPARPPAGGPLSTTVEPGTMLRLPPRTGFSALSEDEYSNAAQTLGCEVLAIKAVALQEGQGKGFDEFNRPVILYEPIHFLHSQDPAMKLRERAPFYRQFRNDYPLLTKLKAKPHPYGLPSANWQYLQWSYLLDPQNALKVVSWGEFQILGSNSGLAGYPSTEQFVTAMCSSLQDQLGAFVKFIQGVGAADALAKKNWADFAYIYNGPKFRDKKYDQLIEATYKKLKAAVKH